MTADLTIWAPVASAIAALASLAWGVWVWLAAARRRELTELQAQVRAVVDDLRAHKDDGARSRGEIKDRLVHLEERLEHMPTAEAQHRLELGLAELRGAIATIGEALKPLARTSARIEDYLLEKGKQ